MAKKIVPVFKFTDGTQPNVTWYTTTEYKELKSKMNGKEKTIPNDKDQQQKDLDFLIERLYKECKTKDGYIGVDVDDIYFDKLEENETLSDLLFHRILSEMEVLSVYSHEYIRDEYDEDLPFRNEHNVMQHVKRLGKFIVKYSPKYFAEEKANNYIKEAKVYL